MPEISTLPQPASAARHSDAGSVVRISPADDPAWDSHVAGLPGGGFFHSSAWARVLAGAYGYRPCHLAVRSNGEIRALFPMVEVDSWLTGRRGVGLPFSDECAPLAGTPADFAALLSAVRAHSRARSWKYAEFRGGRGHFGAGAPTSASFLGHRLDLSAGQEHLFAHCESSTRRAVRKAEQSGLTLEFSRSLAAVGDFHRLLCLTRRRHGLPPQPFGFFAQLQRHVLAANLGWVVLARQGGVAVAGAVFVHFGRTALYKYGASDESFQHLRGNNLVMWEAIRRHAADGFTSLDFGRTAPDNEGLRKFKLGWGAQEFPLDYFRLDPRTGSLAGSATTSERGYRVFRTLPAPVSRLLGSLLYKHVA